MAHEWSELVWEASKYGSGAAVAWMVSGLYAKSKRLYVHATDMNLRFFHRGETGAWSYEDKPCESKSGRYYFEIRFFSRKHQAVALRDIALEFRRGRWRKSVVLRDAELSHGAGYSYAGGTQYEQLKELLVPPNEWVVEKLHGYPKDFEVLRGTSVWFTARTAERSKRRWRVGSITDDLKFVG